MYHTIGVKQPTKGLKYNRYITFRVYLHMQRSCY